MVLITSRNLNFSQDLRNESEGFNFHQEIGLIEVSAWISLIRLQLGLKFIGLANHLSGTLKQESLYKNSLEWLGVVIDRTGSKPKRTEPIHFKFSHRDKQTETEPKQPKHQTETYKIKFSTHNILQCTNVKIEILKVWFGVLKPLPMNQAGPPDSIMGSSISEP